MEPAKGASKTIDGFIISSTNPGSSKELLSIANNSS